MFPLSTEDELRLHDRAMGASSCGITIADARLPDMPLIYINDAFLEITGYSLNETIGRNCRFLQRDDRDQAGVAVIRDALNKGIDSRAVLRNYRKDGTLFHNELHVSPVIDTNGTLTHFIGIQTDVTRRIDAETALQAERTELEAALRELRETQAMLVHSEKMNALGQMVAGVAHEINNPLSYINSNLFSLRTSIAEFFAAYSKLESLLASQNIPMQEAARAIREEADLDLLRLDIDDALTASLGGLMRVKNIVQALRTFSRLDEAAVKEANLYENIDGTLAIVSAELGDRIEVSIDIESMPPLRCRPAELNQVFLNLLLNAAQAIEGKGQITIKGRDLGDRIMIQFIDTGKGMTPDVMSQMFNPFFTTKPVGEGTGLGLSIAYKIITDNHGGTIEAESTPGQGTTITITLPKDANL